jgi:hypothetical protein
MHDTRFWDDVNRLFHRRSNLYYVLGEAFPSTEALSATHGFRINAGLAMGGRALPNYRAVFLTGGEAALPWQATLESVGLIITPGTIPEVIFPGIPITNNGVEKIEEVRVQYTVQDADEHDDIMTALAAGIMALLDGDAIPANTFVRSTNADANLEEIQTGLLTKFNATGAVGPEEVAAVATDETLLISTKNGVALEFTEVGCAVLDKPPSPLLFNAKLVPRLPGIRHFGFTRAFRSSFSATTTEILADQQVPKIKDYISAQAANATFELMQDEDPQIIPVVSGTATQTNDATRDYIIPISRAVQDTYSLIFVAENGQGAGIDYLWLYRGRSAQLDFAREQRTHNPIAVTFSADIFLGRADAVGHYSVPFTL